MTGTRAQWHSCLKGTGKGTRPQLYQGGVPVNSSVKEKKMD